MLKLATFTIAKLLDASIQIFPSLILSHRHHQVDGAIFLSDTLAKDRATENTFLTSNRRSERWYFVNEKLWFGLLLLKGQLSHTVFQQAHDLRAAGWRLASRWRCTQHDAGSPANLLLRYARRSSLRCCFLLQSLPPMPFCRSSKLEPVTRQESASMFNDHLRSRIRRIPVSS